MILGDGVLCEEGVTAVVILFEGFPNRFPFVEFFPTRSNSLIILDLY